MAHRLKSMRKAQGKTQLEIAALVGISQNAYSYWENKRSHIDSESLIKLADFYGVSVDFLAGKAYKVTVQPENWSPELYQKYMRANAYEKEYMEYLYGSIVYESELVRQSEADDGGEELIIFHRDGKNERLRLSRERMSILRSLIEEMTKGSSDSSGNNDI